MCDPNRQHHRNFAVAIQSPCPDFDKTETISAAFVVVAVVRPPIGLVGGN